MSVCKCVAKIAKLEIFPQIDLIKRLPLIAHPSAILYRMAMKSLCFSDTNGFLYKMDEERINKDEDLM